ncbi:MAG: ROK family protein [Micropruina sp.]|uniref:polyphosphate--glucose phosphotransferase n=1 Tax=Micropruina sp. TaxID=2737536 RepID=UPI0039E282A2
MTSNFALGIDIGGSGIKGALVDLTAGDFATERLRIETPQESTPANVAAVVGQIVDNFADQLGDGAIGITVPAIVQHGVTLSAANIHESWVNCPAETIFKETLGRDLVVVNDADAAGVAEVGFGAAKGHPGLVIVTTLGTGIGSAMIHQGVLVPNSELGHLQIDGYVAEKRAAASVRTRENLSWEEYVPRLQRFYETVEFLFSPDLLVVGGGVSKKADKFLPDLTLRTPIVPAQLQNRAGIIGAALLAVATSAHPDGRR